jgi:beta-galactosidase
MSIPSNNQKVLSHNRPASFDKFWYGCAYYPEHWDEATIQFDPKLMREAGMNVVRMGEFAWFRMEPEESKYDFSLFDKAIEGLGKDGISTILCTPTATPPRWLTMKHPEILRINADGIAMQHGSRQHCCHSNPLFRQYSQSITKAMAEHFAGNSNVVGWQTDNEFNCHFSECHCESCQKGYRIFLKEKYDNIENLNNAWGTDFWSQNYTSFDEIMTPRQSKPAYVNPSQQLDYYRYLSYAVTIFQHDQIEILRNIQPKWFIFHNGLFSHIDYRGTFTQDLDMLGFDSYPQFSYDSGYRRYSHAFNLDRARSWSGNFIIPEQQSGPGGQGNYFHDNPEPGEIRRMTYTSIARGADSLLYFRWRTCRFGAEEYWCGILDHDNIPRRRYNEIKQLGNELARIAPEILGTSVMIEVAVATADFDNNDAHQTMTMGLPSPDNIAEIIHAKCFDKRIAIGCVHPSDDLSDIKLYFIPHWTIIKPEWLPNLENFVNNGGILVIGARTGTKNIDNRVISDTPPGLLRKLCGIAVEEYSRCNDLINRPIKIKTDNDRVPIEYWYEVLRPESAEVVATWNGRHITDLPAITCNNIGSGKVYYVGTYLTESVVNAFLNIWLRDAGVKTLWSDSPNDVEVVIRKGNGKKLWFFINHKDYEADLYYTPKGVDLISGKMGGVPMELDKNDVIIIKSEE